MGNVDWGCLAVQVAITGIAFYLVNMLILYKDVDGKAPTIKRDDMNLFLSLLLAILVGYWATTYIKPDCISVPYTKQEGKENFNIANDIIDFNKNYNPKWMAINAISNQIPGNPLGYVQDNISSIIDTASSHKAWYNPFSW
jgi:hypothetical protein